MTVERRLIIGLVLLALLLWAAVGAYAYLSAHHEIDELFDTQQVTLAGHVLSSQGARAEGGAPGEGVDLRAAEVDDMAIAVWSADGRLLMGSRLASLLPYRPRASGFETLEVAGRSWVVYYQRDDRHGRIAAVGQSADERDEVLTDLVVSQLLPWVVMLTVLVLAIPLAVRMAFRPLRALTAEIEQRRADELAPIPPTHVTGDVAPLVNAMNSLFVRIRDALEHERRLTADASHELRTPLAALRAQWDALTLSQSPQARERAIEQVGIGLARLTRLVDQLLSLSAIESLRPEFSRPVDWARAVQRAVSDALPSVEAAGADIHVIWPPAGVEPMPLLGDTVLMSLALRNLIDNACRYGPPGVQVRVEFDATEVRVVDDGPGLPPEVRSRLGARFLRGSGGRASGSGIGISIVLRVAELHGLQVTFDEAAPPRTAGAGDDASPSATARPGLCVGIRRPAGQPASDRARASRVRTS